VAVLAVARWRSGDRRAAREMFIMVAASAVAFLVVYKGWPAFQSGRGVQNWVSPIEGISDRPVVGAPFRELLSTSFVGLNFSASYFLPQSINGEDVMLWNRMLGAVLSAAPFVALMMFPSRSIRWIVGLAALVGVLSYPLVVELQVYIDDHHSYFPFIVPRYGIAFLPWLLAAAALAVAERKLTRITLGFTALGAIVMIGATAGLTS
jgi:hypothetical protein